MAAITDDALQIMKITLCFLAWFAFAAFLAAER
jgi:hypothetical protein